MDTVERFHREVVVEKLIEKTPFLGEKAWAVDVWRDDDFQDSGSFCLVVPVRVDEILLSGRGVEVYVWDVVKDEFVDEPFPSDMIFKDYESAVNKAMEIWESYGKKEE